MAYLAIAHPIRGRSMFPTAQATQATPMTNPRCLMSHISVVMFNGLWNSGNIAPKAMICVIEYVNESEVEVQSLRQKFRGSFKEKSSPWQSDMRCSCQPGQSLPVEKWWLWGCWRKMRVDDPSNLQTNWRKPFQQSTPLSRSCTNPWLGPPCRKPWKSEPILKAIM